MWREAAAAVPRWLGRLIAGEAKTVMMTEIRGASNAKAKRELGWAPRHPSLAAGSRGRRRPCRSAGEAELYEERATCGPRFAIAYRMLGSVGEAEDVVQEALLRLHARSSAGEEIESPQAYLATVVTRLAIDELRSARARRETYVGEWLPEPIVTDPTTTRRRRPSSPTRSRSPSSSSSRASPRSSAPSFLLRDVFDYDYERIAEIVGTARRRAPARGPRPASRRGGPAAVRDVARAARAARGQFFAAVEDGDVKSLERVLAADVELHGDGGGQGPRYPRPIWGARPGPRACSATGGKAGARARRFSLAARVNGQPGAVSGPDGRLISVMALEIGDGEVQRCARSSTPRSSGTWAGRGPQGAAAGIRESNVVTATAPPATTLTKFSRCLVVQHSKAPSQ